jgi:uncharacterized DUF497 family protein
VDDLRFEWDSRKNLANVRKHGVAFEEAQTAFMDENGILIDDPEHAGVEDRFVLLGLSLEIRLLVVCHCYRQDDVIRIISARKANRREIAAYNLRWKK